MRDESLDAAEFATRMVGLARCFRELLACPHDLNDKDEVAAGWLDMVRSCIQAAEETGGDVLKHAIWGPGDPDLDNFRALCKDAARSLAVQAQCLSHQSRTELQRFSDSAPKYIQRFGCTVTHDWFTWCSDLWALDLAPLAGLPNISALEIGSFEGLSACWLLQRILTHRTASITCVDLFEGEAAELFDKNVCHIDALSRVRKIKGLSHVALRAMVDCEFDLVYIDASHEQRALLEDAVFSWRLLKRGGIMIFDDYLASRYFISIYITDDRPDIAIDAFLSVYQKEIEIVRRGYQVVIRKL